MFHVVIPARFGASRLPGKPLLLIGDKPLIQWVWQCARASGALSVTVATDDARIAEAAAGFGAECLMTSPRHASGTDRLAEVVRTKGFGADDIVVNLQGDEPMMPAAVIDAVAAAGRHGERHRPHSVAGGIPRYRVRQGAARGTRRRALFQPRAGAMAAG